MERSFQILYGYPCVHVCVHALHTSAELGNSSMKEGTGTGREAGATLSPAAVSWDSTHWGSL